MSMPLTIEKSQLIKEVRQGIEYLFRVVAFAPNGVKSAPSEELSYFVPG